MPKSICESPAAYEVAASCFKRDLTVARRVTRPADGAHPGETTQPRSEPSSRRALLLLWLFAAAPIVLVLLTAYMTARAVHPTDEELTARFLSNEADFTTLAKMLVSDSKTLAVGPHPFDLAKLANAGASTAQIASYEKLLATAGAKNFRYFPRSGNLLLPLAEADQSVAAPAKSYLYSSDDAPQPLVVHETHAWRGPGMYVVTGDQRIKGRWFIHHDGNLDIAFPPY